MTFQPCGGGSGWTHTGQDRFGSPGGAASAADTAITGAGLEHYPFSHEQQTDFRFTMLPKEKAEQLQTIYRQYETQAAPYKTDAVCGQGCAFCCRHMGDIDAVTLEALVILDHLESLPKPRRLALSEKDPPEQPEERARTAGALPVPDEKRQLRHLSIASFQLPPTLLPCALRGQRRNGFTAAAGS